MKEKIQELSPTDQFILFLEDIHSRNLSQYEFNKKQLEVDSWQKALESVGIDLDRVKERIREIDFEKKHLREFYEQDNGLGRITRSRRIK